MKVYIAGPINGYENLNAEAFLEASQKLIDLGHEPVNPQDLPPGCEGNCKGDSVSDGHKYGCYMIPDLRALLDCEGYTLLQGWEKSKGATVEEAVARICGHTYVEI